MYCYYYVNIANSMRRHKKTLRPEHKQIQNGKLGEEHENNSVRTETKLMDECDRVM